MKDTTFKYRIIAEHSETGKEHVGSVTLATKEAMDEFFDNIRELRELQLELEDGSMASFSSEIIAKTIFRLIKVTG